MKQLKLATNYNNKLGNNIITHLDAAPKEPVPESSLPIEFTIITADASHAPVKYKLISIIRGTLKEFYSDVFTMPSHGMSREDFRTFYLTKHQPCNLQTPMAIYFYTLIC